MKILELHSIIKKIFQTIEFNVRITKIMKIIKSHLRITKIMQIIEYPERFKKNHGNHRISNKNHETNKNIEFQKIINNILKFLTIF